METSVIKDISDYKELDDSGCVQDVSPPKEADLKTASLLDLSDDILLLIFKHVSPWDLKALGYTCPRLGRLITDHTLWQRVDARAQPTGRARLRWMLAHALGQDTTELLLSGYARQARRCLGHVNRKMKEVQEEREQKLARAGKEPAPSTSGSTSGSSKDEDSPIDLPTHRNFVRLKKNVFAMSSGGPASWAVDGSNGMDVDPEDLVLLDGSCPGPQFTLTPCTLRQLRAQCTLTSLALDYCNINCSTTGINHFPPTLKRLSLRGAKCYNLPLDKSFLFNIQDYLPELEFLDLSECSWLEPAAFLPLSKVPRLTELLLQHCLRLTEFVAYASLATRYGFRKLKSINLCGSPVGDSEVSALGWLPALEEVYLSPALQTPPRLPDHSHCRDERLPAQEELATWEAEEPEHYKIKPTVSEPVDNGATSAEGMDEHIEKLRTIENNRCLHGLEYNLCMEGIRTPAETDTEPPPDSDGPGVFDDISTYTKMSFIEHNVPVKVNYVRKKGPIQIELNGTAKVKLPKLPENSRGTSKTLRVTEKSDNGEIKRRIINLSPGPDTRAIDINNIANYNKSLNEPGPSNCNQKRKIDLPGCSTEAKRSRTESGEGSSQDSSVNEEASTSNDSNDDCQDDGECQYVRFRQNMEPEIVRRRRGAVEEEERAWERQMERQERENPGLEGEVQRQIDEIEGDAPARAHVLYVNVGQQLHTVYRLSIHNEPPVFYSFARNSHLRFRPSTNVFSPPSTTHLDASSLVTDSAVRRFGRADMEDVINIGPDRNGEPGARPNRSNLRVLSITGFRNITDRSLVHLATAAPNLQRIDFSNTKVTSRGVANFKKLRPDCEVIFSPYKDLD